MRLGAEEVGDERDYEGLRDRLIEADRQRRVLVSERGQEGGHEAVPRDLAHRGQHAIVEGRVAQLLARKVDLNSDYLDHVPPQDCEMRFAHRLHGLPYTHVGPGPLDPLRRTTVDQKLALQRDTLTEAGCTKIFTEQMSGAVTDRPALRIDPKKKCVELSAHTSHRATFGMTRSNSRVAMTRLSCGSSTASPGR